MLKDLLPSWLRRVVERVFVSNPPAKPPVRNKVLLVLVDDDGKETLQLRPNIDYEKVNKAREAIRAAIKRNEAAKLVQSCPQDK